MCLSQVDVPIRIHNGDTALVTFKGVGYDKRVMGDTMATTDRTEISGKKTSTYIYIYTKKFFFLTF